MAIPNTLPFRFKWASASPDPHNKTMRNTLEPQDIFVQVEVPLKADYFVDIEPIIKDQIGVDVEVTGNASLLTPAGMKYVLQQLSLQDVIEPVSDDEWDDAEGEGETSDDNWDDDESEEKLDDDDDLDWDE